MLLDISTKFTYLQNEKYSFRLMEKQLLTLVKQYPFLTLSEIGKSTQNRPIYCLSLGRGKRKIHVNGAHHANEWITSIIIMRSIEIICRLIQDKSVYLDVNMSNLLERLSYDFVPMVNPDGVELCVNGDINTYDLNYLKQLNEGELNFSRWKANIRGVDLNRNYNAGFEEYSMISEKKGPSYAFYQGEAAESEAESRTLANLTRKRQYDMVFAYHTQGEVIYWTYKEISIANAKEYATIFSKASGYSLDEPDLMAASGGYKDWFILHFRKPGFTIECGHGENPIEVTQINSILTHTLPILVLASKDLGKEE
ncbi:M14 family metallopeptidase [Cellulosilyticum sp. I15G10I2]|uniref:M14 family metallopeptidase n=1 Tax=Cellulosilyticum sp. I15G10I2 TaxID=1892843 RepID=UPI00085C4C6A|nr:M14 family metallocarboxypeptidase [Cellulosilyticum sp. I15G10I2]